MLTVTALCGRILDQDQRSVCEDIDYGVVCASWSGGGNFIETSSLAAMSQFLYDQCDMWELGDSSFVIDKGIIIIV